VPHCPHDALNIQAGRVWWDDAHCQQCDTCLQMCPQQATPMALRLSVEEVMEQVRKVSPFISGITVSGGEATTQLPFLVALFTALKADPQLQHLSCLVDSNGLLSETGWQKLLPVFDVAIPERSDYLTHRRELVAFIRRLGDVPVRINAFHAHGVYGEARHWRSATAEDVEPLAGVLERERIRVIRPALYL